VFLIVTELIATLDSEMFRKSAIDERATTSTSVSFREAVKEIAMSAWTREKRSGVAVVVVIVLVVIVLVVTVVELLVTVLLVGVSLIVVVDDMVDE